MKKSFNSIITFIKCFDQNKIGSLHRIFIVSLFVISFFYSAPLIIEFANKVDKEFQNNSKTILAYTLNNKKLPNENIENTFDESDLLVDIFSLNDLETDTVRLTELAVLFANVPPIKMLFSPDADEKDVVGPRKLTLEAVAATVFVDALSN